ncbi:hypothetical protein [Streptomyces sp. NPDC005573]|uniref:hypothetical protein n=1 Tax=Streptomyces sp. NPDC005573 TaxID=3156890 RepID=UPI0033AA95D8
MATKTDDVIPTDDEGTQQTEEKRDAERAPLKAETPEEPREAAEPAGTPAAGGSEAAENAPDADVDADLDEEAAEPGEKASGAGLGAAAVVSAALGLVSLSGGWVGTIAGARQQLVGQLRTSSAAGVAEQIKAVYGDSWQATALWAGLFALAALITGVVVLVRPAFGAPGRPQAAWIRSVAWAGVSLGVIGLLLAVLKYTGVLFALPSAG